MKLGPFYHVGQRTLRETPIHNPSLDLNGDLKLAVGSMKVRWSMLAIEHANHDSQETANLRHLARPPLSKQPNAADHSTTDAEEPPRAAHASQFRASSKVARQSLRPALDS